MQPLRSFSEMIHHLNSLSGELEVIIPMAESGSALAGVASFIGSLDARVRTILIGHGEHIKRIIEEKNLEAPLKRGGMEILEAEAVETAMDQLFSVLKTGSNQFILKGNLPTDQLMKGLFSRKERIIKKGNIISHIRLFENEGGISLMSDGGINVISNIEDPEKRASLFEKVVKNTKAAASLIGIDSSALFFPGDFSGIEELRSKTESLFSFITRFPGAIQYPWIGPANIVYKAITGTPWNIRFEKELLPASTGAGACSLFLRTSDGKPLLIAVPEKGSGYEEKKQLLREVLGEAENLGITEPRTALLDFTEQYESFMNTPSIADSRKLSGAFKNRAIVEGPLAFDLAVSREAAEIKNYSSRVSGETDILFMPDFTSGVIVSSLYKRWDELNLPWRASDITFGGAIPIIVPSRSDPPEHKLRSIITAAYLSVKKSEQD